MTEFTHFIQAQKPIYPAVLAELRAGQKSTHWMWFIFPQLGALGRSATAIRYGLLGLGEAQVYLAHPLLGPRLIECTRLVNAVTGRSAHEIFDTPDDLKFRSSMTLFTRADPEQPAFADALAKYYDGIEDPKTLALLE
jgi:uncharacterized protein (DUF1810 family)